MLQVQVSHDDFPRSLTFLCPTLPSPKNPRLSHPSLSLHAIIMSKHRVQHTPSTASSQDRQSPAPSQFLISRWMLYSTLYIPTSTSKPMNRVSAAVTPPSKLIAINNCSNLARSLPASASPHLLGQRPRVHFQSRSITASKCITELTGSRPESPSLSSFDLRVQVHLKHARSSRSSWSDAGCTGM